MTDPIWFKFTPKNSSQRGLGRATGAHAFRAGAPRSLCGYVAGRSAGDVAGPDDRRCRSCERVAAGRARDYSSGSAVAQETEQRPVLVQHPDGPGDPGAVGDRVSQGPELDE